MYQIENVKTGHLTKTHNSYNRYICYNCHVGVLEENAYFQATINTSINGLPLSLRFVNLCVGFMP